MKNKFKFLTKESLKRKINTKWFKIVNILLCILLVGILNIDSIIKAFGGDFNEKTSVYIIDNYDGNVYDVFKSQIDTSTSMLTNGTDNDYNITKYDKTLEEAKEEIKDNKKVIVLEFNKDDENVMNVTFLSKEYMELKDMTILNTAINNTKVAYAMIAYNVNPESLERIYKNVEINRVFLDEQLDNKAESTEVLMTTVFPIVVLPFFMLSVILIQMIGVEVNEEKTTKSMEIIISNVSPEVHLASKIVAGNLFVIIQGALLFAYGAIGIGLRFLLGTGLSTGGAGNVVGGVINMLKETSIFSQLGVILPIVLIFLIITFIAYSLLAGILAAMTTNTEDFQQLQTPIMIISLVGYYLAMAASAFKGSLFIRIFSYIPFISAILSPSLLVIGEVGIIDVIISMLITLGAIYWMIKYGIRIYKVGILNYSSKDLWKKLFKSIKQKEV